jgi:hypothetical protein
MSTNWGSVLRKATVYWLEALGKRLVWVSKTVPPERIVTVIGWLLGIADNPSKEVRVNSLGYLVATALLTVIVVMGVVNELPALSLAMAVRLWLELVKVVVSKGLLTEAEVEVAKILPSINRVTKDSPEVTWPATVGSEAEAEKVRVPDTVPAKGLVMETVGGVVSGAAKVVADEAVDWGELLPAES